MKTDFKLYPLMQLMHRKRAYFAGYLWFLMKRFFSDRCPQIAASLTYTILLAMVPLLAFTLAIISQIPEVQQYLETGQQYLFEVFAPHISHEVQGYLMIFVSKTKNLTSIGIIIIGITALLTLATIESTLNRIWQVKVSRKILARIISYMIILILGPVVIGVSLSITTYFSTLPFVSNAIDLTGHRHLLLSFLPVISTTIAFTLLYKFVPNIKVPINYAFIGGLVAAILFELSKRGFALFITSFASYQLIYGALAAIPITLVWLYLSWLVILFGAEVTACLSDYAELQTIGKISSDIDLCIIIKILGDIGFAAKQNKINTRTILQQETHIPDIQLKHALCLLEEKGFIVEKNDIWQLARDKKSYQLQELLVLSNPCCSDYHSQKNQQTRIRKNVEKALAGLVQALENTPPILLESIYNDNNARAEV